MSVPIGRCIIQACPGKRHEAPAKNLRLASFRSGLLDAIECWVWIANPGISNITTLECWKDPEPTLTMLLLQPFLGNLVSATKIILFAGICQPCVCKLRGACRSTAPRLHCTETQRFSTRNRHRSGPRRPLCLIPSPPARSPVARASRERLSWIPSTARTSVLAVRLQRNQLPINNSSLTASFCCRVSTIDVQFCCRY